MSHVLIPDVIEVQNKQVFFVQAGERNARDVVLVLHGFMSDYRSLQTVTENLQVPVGTTILLPDLPGFGSSEPFKQDGINLKQYISWVDDFMAATVPMAENVTIIGYSFGSYIAVSYAALRPTKLKSLILITPVIKVATSVRLFSSIFDNLADLSVDVAHAVYKWRPNVDLTSLYLTRSRHPEKVMKLLRQRREELNDLKPQMVLELTRELLKYDLLALAPQIEVPVFVVAAKHDTVAVNSATRTFIKTLGRWGDLHFAPKAGHLIPFENPDLINEILDAHYWPTVRNSVTARSYPLIIDEKNVLSG